MQVLVLVPVQLYVRINDSQIRFYFNVTFNHAHLGKLVLVLGFMKLKCKYSNIEVLVSLAC